jgi:hypothetical protein
VNWLFHQIVAWRDRKSTGKFMTAPVSADRETGVLAPAA